MKEVSEKNIFHLSYYDFELPKELIAQYPSPEREKSRLLVLHREPFRIEHRVFSDIHEYFEPGDVLVLNRTKVIKARVWGKRKKTGGKVELFITGIKNKRHFEALVKPGRKAPPGEEIDVQGITLRVIERLEGGKRLVELDVDIEPLEFLDKFGETPLPPYVRRKPEKLDEERYQTVYAEVPGSVAAPTAGLHFTKELLKRLEDKGVIIKYVLLHVGPGTFRPVKVDDVREHRMEEEYFEISEDTQSAILEAKKVGKRIISCGTTVTRALETWKLGKGPSSGYTELFIYPPYRFRVIDGMITNFHLPRSTPLLLVSALAGRDKIMKAYQEAIKLRYRFFSYGDAMLII